MRVLYFLDKIHQKLAYIKKKQYLCSVIRKWVIVLMACSMSLGLMAETRYDAEDMRHEIRIGWGDQLFESLVWHNPTAITKTMPENYRQVYHEDYHHDQHVWAEYRYRFKYWFSLGCMVDWSDVRWDDVTRNGLGEEVSRDKGHWFYNIVVMPTIRFTYYHHPNVNLYSGLGFGMDINGGSESNAWGKKTDIGAAFDLTLFGVSANYQRWFMTVDFGGLFALKNANTIFLGASRIINVGIGARF
jgi:hypothetical protein